jgi:hypothetical protein
MAKRPFTRGGAGHLRDAWTTKRERILYNNTQCLMWAAAAEYDGDHAKAASIRARIKPVPAERVRKPKDVSKAAPPLEAEVLKSVVKALKSDPRVARVQRNQSGVFHEGDRWIRVGERGLLDLTVYLKSGRYIEIEVKRPGGAPKPHQAARIADIKSQGGLAGYAWSAESALALLPS